MKRSLFAAIFAVFLLLIACSSTQSTLEQFQGYAVERVKEKGREKILVVSGITQEEALQKTYKDVAASEDHDNIIWFVNEENSFMDIQKGERVAVWWDSSREYNRPSIVTLVAEKVEVIKE